tara:strand:+ start:194 stop:556 length:363 start_codon:yes stop_codon:yes gene_type:complete
MGGAILKAAYMGGLTTLGRKIAKENPDTKSPIGQVFVALAKQEKEKEAQKQAQLTAATKGAAPMASPSDVDPGPVEFAGNETDQTGRRRRRRQVRGQAIPARRRSLLAEQNEIEDERLGA